MPDCSFASSKPQELPECNLKLSPISEEQGESEERGSPLATGTWQFELAREITMRLVLSSAQREVPMHPPARILKVYIEALTGFSHVYCPDDLTLFFQGCILENSSPCENGGSNIYSKDREGNEEPSVAWVLLGGQLMVMSSQ